MRLTQVSRANGVISDLGQGLLIREDAVCARAASEVQSVVQG
jgi:hypothetical protein